MKFIEVGYQMGNTKYGEQGLDSLAKKIKRGSCTFHQIGRDKTNFLISFLTVYSVFAFFMHSGALFQRLAASL